jgi:nucleotide sugar dehydrogenase
MNQLAEDLLQRLQTRRATIGILGLGYVGLPLALEFAEAGLRVIGFDTDPEKPRRLAAGESYINYLPPARIAAARAAGFEATTDFTRLPEADALILCVPTPLDVHREPDLSYVIETTRTVAAHLRPGQLVSLESTTWPGTTDEVLRPLLEGGGLKVGEDVFLVYSPERADPGNPRFGTRDIPKLVGGATATCTEIGIALYRHAVDRVVPVSGTRVAEMAKLLENIHRAVNIGLVNEMKLVADAMGLDIHEIIDAAATKPFGFVPYHPGPGLGGHCIPIDPFYLTWKAREYGVHTRFIELAGEINHAMPDFVVRKTVEALNQRGRALRGARVLILGIAYKKNVDDLRESPALEILDRLVALGAEVAYCDPHIPRVPPLRRGRYALESQKLSAESLAACDCALLVTDHDAFDYPLILRHAPLVVDTRGRWRGEHAGLVRA